MFHSLFRKKAKLTVADGTSSSRSNQSSRTSSSSRIPVRRGRGPALNPKLRIYTPNMTGSVKQAAFCMPSCPIEDDLHSTGLYCHNGEFSHSMSFLFGAQNPPPEIWHAHDRLMMGEASQEDEELVLSFLAHHPFQAGNVTDSIYFGEQGQLMMMGNPLNFTVPEISPMVFEPIKVAPITSHPYLGGPK